MEFEFDEEKSLANKEKHGIDFDEARALWLDAGIVARRDVRGGSGSHGG